MSGIQGCCEADRCEGEYARCCNATGLRWFFGNPDDALTADQWVELGVHLMSEVSSGLRRASRFVSACQCQNQERHGRKASLVRTPTMIPARFTFHVCDGNLAGIQSCIPRLYELTVSWFLGVEHPQNILKLYSKQV